MTILLSVLSGILLLSLIALGFSVYFNFKLGRLILSVEDQVEESLDILDENYQRIASIAATPLLSDEPVIRDVMLNIRLARDSVLLVANKLVKFESNDLTQETNDDNTNLDNTHST